MGRVDAPDVRDGWIDDNERGLALAAESDWSEAAEAFASAADSLARAGSADVAQHEPLSLVLGNLAQACFRSGRVDQAILHAQRTCALRVAIAGEGGLPVARARMDLAVMLATSGRLDEAMALVQRAIVAVEHHVGDEDVRLAMVLENAARIALAAGVPSGAEPLLLRLHALLHAHDLSTSRADQLLARIAAVRARQAQATPAMPMVVPVSETMFEPAPAFARTVTPAFAPAVLVGDAADAEWEDQPLRDAVALTDVLLRTTPTGVPAIADPLDIDLTSEMEPAREIAFIAEPSPVASEVIAVAAESTAGTDALDLDSLGLDALGLELADPAPPVTPPVHEPAHETFVDETPAPLLIDFEVQHGAGDVPVDDFAPDADLSGVTGMTLELAHSPAAAPIAPVQPGAGAPLAARGPTPRATVVLPSPHAGAPVVRETADVPRPRPRAPHVAQSSGGGSGKIIAIVAGVAVAGGAAWWFLFR